MVYLNLTPQNAPGNAESHLLPRTPAEVPLRRHQFALLHGKPRGPVQSLRQLHHLIDILVEF
jgi:hypothetical protein